MELLFVYGTLKKGYGNHRVLGPKADFIGKGSINGFKMYHGGGFPYINPSSNNANIIYGELYAIPNLKDTDRLEGYPHHYDRCRVTVHLIRSDTGTPYTQEAWVYHAGEFFNPLNYKVIERGEWQ